MKSSSRETKRLDRRVVRTRKAIMNAFDKLVSNSSIDKITVSAIAREADIDRKTFYLHYSSIDDLANRKAEEGLERVLEKLKADGAGKSFAERIHIVLVEVNAILSENIVVYANIASRLSIDQMLERFEQAAQPAMQHSGIDPRLARLASNQQVHMRLQFLIAGAVSLYSSWLKSDHKQPIESVSAAIESTCGFMYLEQKAAANAGA